MTGSESLRGNKENDRKLSREEQLKLWKQQRKPTSKAAAKGGADPKGTTKALNDDDNWENIKPAARTKREISEVIKVSSQAPQESEQTKPGPIKKPKPQPLATKHNDPSAKKDEKLNKTKCKTEPLKPTTSAIESASLNTTSKNRIIPHADSDAPETDSLIRLQNELADRQKDISRLEARLASETERSSTLELELKARTQDVSDFRLVLKNTSSKLRKAEFELQQQRQAHKEVEQLLERTKTSQASALKAEVDRVQSLEASLASKSTYIEKLEAELRVAREKEQNATERTESQQNAQLLESITQLQQRNETLSSRCKSLETDKITLKKSVEDLSANLEQVETSREELSEANALLKFQYADAVVERDRLSSELQECYEAMDAVEAKLTEYEGKEEYIDKAAAMAEEQEAQLLAAEGELFKLRGEVQILGEKNEELQNCLETLLQDDDEIAEPTPRPQTTSTSQQTEITFTEGEAQTELNLQELLDEAKEAVKNFHLIKFGNNVMHQQMLQNQEVHAREKSQLEEQLSVENQKWRDLEAEQAKIHQKLLDALQQSLLKKREAEVRLQEIERMNEILKERITELGGIVDGRSGGVKTEEVEEGLDPDVSIDLGGDETFESEDGGVDFDVSVDLSVGSSFASEDGAESEEDEDGDEEEEDEDEADETGLGV
ncbi:hypothetical protein HK097_001677 [Rhizophlyctis rosea]|uniref:Uncharacterized protein n=1 Tax=Rhizophlyctis rosea TaxID=64517 RepID=A0AAD5SHJ2_9FUNG|nr:hypothetical protein HK097_001677 [Rhizophlyctis rosea]